MVAPSDLFGALSVPGDPPPDMFEPVTTVRMSQVVVDQIRAHVRSGRLSPGDKLPSERDMCDVFAVSRVTVREALRILEANGIVEIRIGAQGGAFITSPSRQRVGESLADLMLLSPITALEVTEARIVLEMGLIPLVVERATSEDLDDLRRLCEQARVALANDTYTMAMSGAFHMRLASSAHNTAIESLAHGFYGNMVSSLRQAQNVAPVMGHVGTQEHLAVVEAIAARNVEAATSVMSRHLHRTEERVRSAHSESVHTD